MSASTEHRPAEIEVADVDEFLTQEGLARKAGCTWRELPTLCIKELVDNSFDFPGAVYEFDEENGEHIITDEGPGLSCEDILRLFNIRRPMTSTKRWRRAGRGALGNGLRVACAAVRSLDGSMTITSRDGAFLLTFDEIGRNSVERIGPAREIGTEIRVTIDGDVDAEVIKSSTLVPGSVYDGPANSWAFGMMDFRAIARQCDRMTEKQFAAQFGCDVGREIPLAEIDDEGIKKLHGQLKHRNTKNTVLPGMGENALPYYWHHEASGMVDIGRGGLVPATVDAWVISIRKSRVIDAHINCLWMNRTRSFTQPSASYSAGDIVLRNCGLRHIKCKAPKSYYVIKLAVTSSFFPMTSDGKAPDLSPFAELIKKAVRKAAKDAHEHADAPEPKAKRDLAGKPEKATLRDAVFAVMEEAMRHASTGYQNKVTPRQVFYSARPLVKERFGSIQNELKDSYFTQTLLPEYRETHDVSHWPVVDYDARGNASEPHGGKKIQLSTSGVSNYKGGNPNLGNFGAVLYIEKEQFSELISEVQNEFDLLLVEAKGQGTLAEKDLLRWAEEKGLPVFVFSDFDVAGLLIYETIKNGSKRAKPVPAAKRVGLTLKQSQELDLMPEPCSPGANLVTWLNRSSFDDDSKEFLRHNRFELNHLTTKQMIDLLREELAAAGVEKVLPSIETIRATVREDAVDAMREFILAEAEDRINAFADAVLEDLDHDMLFDGVEEYLRDHPQLSWRQALATKIHEAGVIDIEEVSS